MSKRVLMAALAVGVGLATLHGGPAEAGTWSYIRPPGTWYYFGSVEACALIGSVPNPAKHPARLYCSVDVTKVESLCLNPNNHDVSPGEAATQVIFSTAQGITPNNLLSKTKGTAALCAEVSSTDADCTLNPGDPLCDDNFCVNPNWHIVRVMTTEFQANCQTQACASGIVDKNFTCCTSAGVDSTDTCINPNGTWVTKDTQVCDCTLPAPYGIENPPPHCDVTDPLHPHLVNSTDPCVAYQCFDVATGAACQLQ